MATLWWISICLLGKVYGHDSNIIPDYETAAIIEATKIVDGYYQWRTQNDPPTVPGAISNGRRNYPFIPLDLVSRPEDTEQRGERLGRSARIATLATQIILARGGIPGVKSFQLKMSPVCAIPKVKCDPTYFYRSIDGSCNNLNFPLWGKSSTAQPRFIPPNYDDKLNLGFEPRLYSKLGGYLPNPRFITNMFNTKGTSLPRNHFFNDASTIFGQFVTHDVTFVNQIGNPSFQCCVWDKPVIREECFSFSTPPGEFKSTCMSFVRSEMAPYEHCAPGFRNQMNQATSYIDLSVLYGSNAETAASLIDPKTGKLKNGPCDLMEGHPGPCMGFKGCFRSGDRRHSTVPGLTSFHILFHREHNRIVDILCVLNPHWTGKQLYEEARKIVIGIYQHIIYNEYLPTIIGKNIMKMMGILPTLKGYNTRYDDTVDASTRNSFAVAAFRFSHAQILDIVGSSNLDRSLRTKVPLKFEFFKTRLIRDKKAFGVDGISRWMTTEFANKADRFLPDSVRNHLFQTQPGNGFDLGALDIQRGRDHGIPSYNDFRRFCGLKPAVLIKAGPFGLPDHDPKAAEILSVLYKHPEDIDLITGGMSEINMKNALVGPTFGCLISLQFKLLRDGDRFFYENAFPKTGFNPAQLAIIKLQSLSALFCRNFKMGVMQPIAFVSSLAGQPPIPCGAFPQLGPLELTAWK